jgi:hypothetical protein
MVPEGSDSVYFKTKRTANKCLTNTRPYKCEGRVSMSHQLPHSMKIARTVVMLLILIFI